MIPPAFIQELLGRVDVGEVVGRYVKLRKSGANLMGLCPFHGEKSPSFSVRPDKDFYHCFGCGAHGNAIGFLMEHLGLSFPDAVADLAQEVGLTVPHEPGTGGREASARRDPGLLELMSTAANFYKRRLRDTPRAVDYLKQRGLTGEIAARFAIGFAPDAWRGLEAAVPDYDVPELVECGLVVEAEPGDATGPAPAAARVIDGRPSEAGAPASGASGAATGRVPGTTAAGATSAAGASGATSAAGGAASAAAIPAKGGRRRRYDRFRDRIMFPIRNPRGQVIAFGGRVLGQGGAGQGGAKYLNSPETPLFSKSHELYGLYEGREALRRLDCALVVEGYMDVVMLAQHGIDNAVATLGTATTADHVRKLLRVVGRVVFAFDGDAAGRKAAWRALEICLPHADDTKRLEFLFLPAEHDPDSYVRAHGPDALRALIEQAESLSAFVLRSLGEQVDLEQAEGRARLLALARPLLQGMPPIALRLQLIHELAERARISAGEFGDYLRAGGTGTRNAQPRPSRPQASGGDPGPWSNAAADDPGAWEGGEAADEPPDHWGDPGAQGRWGEGRQGGTTQGGWEGAGARRGPAWQGRSAGRQGGGMSGPGGGGGQPWRGRGGRDGVDGVGGVVGRAQRPASLERRVVLLSGRFPVLAREGLDSEFLPPDLKIWLDALGRLAADATFMTVCETFRGPFPRLVAQLQTDTAAADAAGMLEGMGLADARHEFDAALRKLQKRGVKRAMDELVAGGMASEDDRRRHVHLQAIFEKP